MSLGEKLAQFGLFDLHENLQSESLALTVVSFLFPTLLVQDLASLDTQEVAELKRVLKLNFGKAIRLSRMINSLKVSPSILLFFCFVTLKVI